MDCGFEGMGRGAHACALPSTDDSSYDPTTPCVCFASGPKHDAFYRCDKPNTSQACVGDARGEERGARCCARPAGGCLPGWRPCTWHAENRIAWLHAPKTGTSFLLALARMANQSIPSYAKVSKLEDVRHVGTQWDAFLNKYTPSTWFRGSDVLGWRDGMAHAAISNATYREFHSRFFAMFRDPRERGWSAYNYFLGDAQSRAAWSPERYAECIQGLVVGMIAPSWPCKGCVHFATRAFGTVQCYLAPRDKHNVINTSGVCGCGPFVPNVNEAIKRVDEGFAFAGIVEEWALSMCLFAVRFNVPCVPSLFSNSRPTDFSNRIDGGKLNRTPPSVYRDDAHRDVFADKNADGRLYQHVRFRFRMELLRYNVTNERCAMEVCPEKASLFV